MDMKTSAASLLLALSVACSSAAHGGVITECMPAFTDSSLPGYLDLQKAVVVTGPDGTDLALYLRELPSAMQINRFRNPASCSLNSPCYSEYSWWAMIGADGTLATDSGEDYYANVSYVPNAVDAVTTVDTAGYGWAPFFGTFQVSSRSYRSSAGSSYRMDLANKAVILKLPYPKSSLNTGAKPVMQISASERDGDGNSRTVPCALAGKSLPPVERFSISGSLETAKLFTTATGSLETLSLTAGLYLPPTGQYNVYVLAVVPGQAIFTLGLAGWQPVTSQVLQPYARGVSSTPGYSTPSAIHFPDPYSLEVFNNMPVAALKGVEIYVGYGTDNADFLATSRLRGIYLGI